MTLALTSQPRKRNGAFSRWLTAPKKGDKTLPGRLAAPRKRDVTFARRLAAPRKEDGTVARRCAARWKACLRRKTVTASTKHQVHSQVRVRLLQQQVGIHPCRQLKKTLSSPRQILAYAKIFSRRPAVRMVCPTRTTNGNRRVMMMSPQQYLR